MDEVKRGRLSWEDWVALVFALALASGVGWLLTRVFVGATDDQVSTALTNTATVGGIVAGLSIAGLSALSLSSERLRQLQAMYGSHIRGALLGLYGCAATIAVACGVVAAFPDWEYARYLAGFSPPFLIVLLLISTFVVTSLYRIGSEKPKQRPPLKPPPKYDAD